MSEWISVKDRLPEMGTCVLFFQTFPAGTPFNCRADPMNKCFIHVGGLRCDGAFIDIHNQFGDNLKHVTHWMPLPEPPNATT